MRRGLAKTLELLSANRVLSRQPSSHPTLLEKIGGFGDNPGGLAMLVYVPPTLGPNAPLVVVLHGCTQSAESYASGAGWIEAADRFGFALLCPEQVQRNNPNLCFNWFVPENTRRGGGEAASIAQMVAHLVNAHALDTGRVFITGLSAGGAMANVMLASYPELFRAGAIIAGLPYGSARNVQEAFAAMSHQRDASDPVLGARIRAAAPEFAGPWPTISVWHGNRDATVSPAAGEAIARQWANVHGAAPALPAAFAGNRHRTWTDAAGAVVVEHHLIDGMGHGTPLDTRMAGGVGKAGPYLLNVGVSSTLKILESWGLQPLEHALQVTAPPRQRVAPNGPIVQPAPRHRPTQIDVGAIINDALRAAGLLK